MPFTYRYFLAVRFSFADFNLSYSRIVYVIIVIMTSHLYDYYDYSGLVNSYTKDLENLRNFFQGLHPRTVAYYQHEPLGVLRSVSTCLHCLTYVDRKFTSTELNGLNYKICLWKEYKNKILEADIKSLFSLGFGH